MKITEEKARELWQDKMSGELTESDEQSLQGFLAKHPAIAS